MLGAKERACGVNHTRCRRSVGRSVREWYGIGVGVWVWWSYGIMMICGRVYVWSGEMLVVLCLSDLEQTPIDPLFLDANQVTTRKLLAIRSILA